MLDSQVILTNALALLEATKIRLLEYGWIQGNMGPQQGPNCIAGAFLFATVDSLNRYYYPDEWNDAAFMASNLLLKVIDDEGMPALSQWNDAFRRTERDVYDALDKAILLAKEALSDSS